MRAFVIHSSDIDRCPIRSFNPNHYRDDGSCLHVPPVDAQIAGGHVAYPPAPYDPLSAAIAEVAAGLSEREVAARYGVSVWKIRRGHGVAGRPYPTRY